MKRIKHWQDGVNALLGLAVMLSPWAMGVQGNPVVTSNAVLAGVALIAAAMGAILIPRVWEEWTEGLIGLWLMASPWVLGFSDLRQPMLAAAITGIVVVALAMWTLLSDKNYRNWPSDEKAAH